MTPPNKGSVIERPGSAPAAPPKQDLTKNGSNASPGVGDANGAGNGPRAASPKLEWSPDQIVGEGVSLQERLIVAPCPGRFQSGAISDKRHGEFVLEGQEIGRVLSSDGEDVPVKSSFSGWIMGYLVPEASPVRAAEPVAWLRPF